jgi:polysaccharide lyase-like protein
MISRAFHRVTKTRGRRLALAGIVVVTAAAAIGLTVLTGTDGTETPGDSSGLLWRADFETGDLSQWEGVQQAVPNRASVVRSPHVQGSYAGRIEVREGEFIGGDAPTRNRTQLVLSPRDNRHNPKEGDDWWYSWSFYLPAATPIPTDGKPGFMILFSWSALEAATAPEILGHFEIRDTTVGGDPGPGYTTLHYEDGDSRADGHKYFWRKRATDITRNAWHKLLVHRKYSTNEAVGFVEIWYDNVQQTLQTNAAGDTGTRVYHRTLQAGHSVRMTQGIYRSNSVGGTGLMYLDGLRIGTTRKSVGD